MSEAYRRILVGIVLVGRLGVALSPKMCASCLLHASSSYFGRHYLSNATCLVRPHLFSTALLA